MDLKSANQLLKDSLAIDAELGMIPNAVHEKGVAVARKHHYDHGKIPIVHKNPPIEPNAIAGISIIPNDQTSYISTKKAPIMAQKPSRSLALSM